MIIIQIIMCIVFTIIFCIMIGVYYLVKKPTDQDGYITLNRRDVLLMIIFFPITISTFLFYKVLNFKVYLINKSKYKNKSTNKLNNIKYQKIRTCSRAQCVASIPT